MDKNSQGVYPAGEADGRGHRSRRWLVRAEEARGDKAVWSLLYTKGSRNPQQGQGHKFKKQKTQCQARHNGGARL